MNIQCHNSLFWVRKSTRRDVGCTAVSPAPPIVPMDKFLLFTTVRKINRKSEAITENYPAPVPVCDCSARGGRDRSQNWSFSMCTAWQSTRQSQVHLSIPGIGHRGAEQRQSPPANCHCFMPRSAVNHHLFNTAAVGTGKET